jgi:Ser/Thr protein kinase RdoA (MazF antagonist)
MSEAQGAVERFALDGPVSEIAPLAGGHIHDSYRVEAGSRIYLLQRINPEVFPRPEVMLENVCAVSAYRAERLRATAAADWGRRAPVQIPPRAGDGVGDAVWDGTAWWRLFTFVGGAVAHQRATNAGLAREAGRAFGALLRLLADWDRPPLRESLPAFHDTERRVLDLDRAVAGDTAGRVAAAGKEIEMALRYRPLAAVLPPLLAAGAVPRRLVHNDAKISNVLCDARSGAWLCVVDLDTVMPGTALYDFGDLVRSTVSPADEDEADVSRIDVRLDLFEALTQGYLETAGTILSAQERDLLVFAGELITFEQAIRFLTDHLEGDRYYRVARPGHNLTRARAQLALLAALRRRQAALTEILTRLASTRSRS